MPNPCCKRCGGPLRDSIAPKSGNKLRWCPACHAKAKRLARSIRPEKVKAQRRVAYAIERGLLQRQPCEVCGVTDGVEAHHPDYSHPLAVRWLCRLHHRRLHAALRRAGK